MELRPVDMLGGFYADDSKPWSVQDTVNWLPEVAEVAGTRTQMKLASPPGLREFMRLGDRPIRGLRNVEGTLFAVCGNDLHQVSTKATSTVRGQIPGVGRVQMAHNQITGGNELLIVNGQSTGYVWNTAKNTYLRITDDGYPGARAADYLDSYLLQVEPFGRFWFHSQLANALDYNTIDHYESEASPDKIVTLIVSQFEVVVFNETTTEFFYNAGTDTNTFQNKRVLIDRGCASGDTVQKLDNSVFWLGNDGVVYRLNGYQAVPISTGPIQAAIRDNNWKQAFSFTWEDGKHKVYYLTFPDGKTWGYDVVTGVWHRRASFGLDRWRLNHVVRWNGMWIGSDFQNGRLWVLDWDYHLEGNNPIISERISPVLHNNQNEIGIPNAELIIDTGQGPGTQPNLPKLTGDLPNSLLGQPLSFQYSVTGGVLPYGPVEVVGGQFPPGLVLAASGAVAGTPTVAGSYSWTLRVRDADGDFAMLTDDAMVVDAAAALPLPVTVRLLLGVNGGGAPNIATDTTRNQPWLSTLNARSGDWALIHTRSWATGVDGVPPDSRTLIYRANNQAGGAFQDSGWWGDTAHQSAMSTALSVAGLSQYDGAIQANPRVVVSGTSNNFYQTPIFEYPPEFATDFSGRLVIYRAASELDTGAFIQYPDPAFIPIDAVKLAGLPGYYKTSAGTIYRVNWNLTAVGNS